MKILENGKALMEYETPGGKKYPVEVNLIVDARDLMGLAGFPWIVMAANPQLSNDKLAWFLFTCDIEGVVEGVERSEGWIQRRRWMFRRASQHPHATQGRPHGRDHARAIEIMRNNPTLSARQLVRELRRHGINRERTWVLKNRCG